MATKEGCPSSQNRLRLTDLKEGIVQALQQRANNILEISPNSVKEAKAEYKAMVDRSPDACEEVQINDEAGRLAINGTANQYQIKNARAFLDAVTRGIPPCNKVRDWAMAKVKFGSSSPELIFFVQSSAAVTNGCDNLFKVRGKQVRVLSSDSPLAKHLENFAKGQKSPLPIEFRDEQSEDPGEDLTLRLLAVC